MIATVAAVVAGVVMATYLVCSAAQLTVGSLRTTRAIRRRHAMDPSADERARHLVLLPMLREDRVVAAAGRHFLEAVQADDKIEVIVVTSRSEAKDRAAAQEALRAMAITGDPRGWGQAARLAVLPAALSELHQAVRGYDAERVEKLLFENLRPTTAEIAGPVIEALNGECGRVAFHHVEVAAAHHTKVQKLNAAVAEWIAGAQAQGTPTYVGVYDADSAPDLYAFRYINDELARRRARGEPPPPIFQQVSCYCRGLPTLTGTRGVFALADAVAQTRWALGFEYPLYERYSRAVRRRRVRPLVYCVGHGCFVSLAFLREIGGFPSFSPTDDLALGYLATALGADVTAIPAMDYCEVAPNPIVSMRQSRFWFSGSARFWRDLREARRMFRPEVTPLQWIKLHLDGFGRNVAWAGRGPAWLVALVLAAGAGQWWVAGALLAAHVLYVQAGYAATVLALRRLPAARERTGLDAVPRSTLIAAGLAASGTFVLRSLGPFTGAVQAIWHRASGPVWKHER